MNGSTGGGSLSHGGKSKLNVRSLRYGGAEGACERGSARTEIAATARTTGGVKPASYILSRIFCLDLACFTKFE